MTDVEQLLRDTLNDPRRRLEPGADIFPAVLTAARHRQRMRAIVRSSRCSGGSKPFAAICTERSRDRRSSRSPQFKLAKTARTCCRSPERRNPR